MSEESWLPEILVELETFHCLKVDWDSYGAAAANTRSLGQAASFARCIAKHAHIPAPSVGLNSDGNAGFSWHIADWSLDVEILPTGQAEYVSLKQRVKYAERDEHGSTLNWNYLIGLFEYIRYG